MGFSIKTFTKPLAKIAAPILNPLGIGGAALGMLGGATGLLGGGGGYSNTGWV